MRVYVAITGDLFHYGHVAFLKSAKSFGTDLIVGVCSDADVSKYKRPPIMSLNERIAVIESCKYVDEVIIYCTEADLLDIINMYPINVRILGEEYRTQNFTGKDECRNRGIDLYFNKRDHRFSSSGLRTRVCDNHK